MPKAIVTGASGFVGSHLAELLLEKGWRVTAALRQSSQRRWLEGSAMEFLEIDFTRPFRLPPCDVVFHVAGVLRADTWHGYLEGNRDLARRVFEASSASRFVHVSSLAVQGPRAEADETTPCEPISMYGKSKGEGEREVWTRRDRLPVTVIRPPVVYGPRDLGLLELFKVVASGIRPIIGGPKRLSIIHVRDLVEGMLAAAESSSSRTLGKISGCSAGSSSCQSSNTARVTHSGGRLTPQPHSEITTSKSSALNLLRAVEV